MFFLGGFNSILPHLLYLLLVWVFLMIGFSTRANWLRQEKKVYAKYLNQTDGQMDQLCSAELLHDFVASDHESTPQEFHTIEKIFVPESVQIYPRQPARMDYRGPPI